MKQLPMPLAGVTGVADRVIGIGPTPELSLRVSVATLTRVVFPRPADGIPMLALENKATLISEITDRYVTVIAQPFGGAIRILNLDRFLTRVGSFNFDSESARSAQDFRIFIRFSSWEVLREYCLQKLGMDDSDLETDPYRELVEEFNDTLGIQLRTGQYEIKPVKLVLENEPALTENLHASGSHTVRIYRVDEAQIKDPILYELMITNSEKHSVRTLKSKTMEDAQKGGRGRANAMLVVPIGDIQDAYLALPPEKRGEKLCFKGRCLAGNVAAILGDVFVPKYRHYGFFSTTKR